MCKSLETISKAIDVLEKMYNLFNKIISRGTILARVAQTAPLLCLAPSPV